MGFGTFVVVKASSGPICPVAALKNFLQVRPNFAGSLFCHFLGTTITRYQLSPILKRSLNICNIDDTNFKSHSFRIGAATSLARQGTEKHNSNGRSLEVKCCQFLHSLRLIVKFCLYLHALTHAKFF